MLMRAISEAQRLAHEIDAVNPPHAPHAPNAVLQMQDFRALVNARTAGDQALWHELGDLLHSVFDSLDNLQSRINELKSSGGGNDPQT